jgi:hypothetical protein
MKQLALPFMMLALAACAGPVETRIDNTGQAGAVIGTYVLAETGEAESPELLQARKLVADRLAVKGLTASDTGTYHLEVTVSSRSAVLGLKQEDRSLSGPKPKKPFQNCKDSEYRFGIALTRIVDGAEMYRGSAAEYHCRAGLEQTLPTLVNAALADLGAPKGQYVLKRKGRE